jgi:hypothetical protein
MSTKNGCMDVKVSQVWWLMAVEPSQAKAQHASLGSRPRRWAPWKGDMLPHHASHLPLRTYFLLLMQLSCAVARCVPGAVFRRCCGITALAAQALSYDIWLIALYDMEALKQRHKLASGRQHGTHLSEWDYAPFLGKAR